jgi:hypothetical protein
LSATATRRTEIRETRRASSRRSLKNRFPQGRHARSWHGSIPDNIKAQLEELVASSAPPGWESIRKSYPITKGAPKANAVYDIMAKGDAMINGFQELMGQRMDQIKGLINRIDSAEDPAAKQDLMNRIASEQAAIGAAESLMMTAIQKHKTEVRHAEVEAMEEYRCYQFASKDC